jgi:hypothetical protein
MAFSLRRKRSFGVPAAALALLLPAAAAHAQTQLTVTASADASVNSAAPTKSYGSDKWLKVGRGKTPTDPVFVSFIRFDVTGIDANGTVSDATLRLTAKDPISYGANVLRVTNDWTESALTWDNGPFVVPPVRILGYVEAVTPGTVDIDLDPSVFTQDGSYSFGLATPATQTVRYSSREGANPPQLLLTVDPPDATADDSGDDGGTAAPPPPKRTLRCVHISSRRPAGRRPPWALDRPVCPRHIAKHKPRKRAHRTRRHR